MTLASDIGWSFVCTICKKTLPFGELSNTEGMYCRKCRKKTLEVNKLKAKAKKKSQKYR